MPSYAYQFVVNVDLDLEKYNATFHESYETPGEVIYTVADDLVESARLFFERSGCGVHLDLAAVLTPRKVDPAGTCTTCGRIYRRTRAAPDGPTRSNNYCPACHADGTAARFMKQQQRKHKKEVQS